MTTFDEQYDSVFYYMYMPFYHEGNPEHWRDSALIYKHIVGEDSNKDELIIDYVSRKIQCLVGTSVGIITGNKKIAPVNAVQHITCDHFFAIVLNGNAA